MTLGPADSLVWDLRSDCALIRSPLVWGGRTDAKHSPHHSKPRACSCLPDTEVQQRLWEGKAGCPKSSQGQPMERTRDFGDEE